MLNWVMTQDDVHRVFPAFISREAHGEGLGDGGEEAEHPGWWASYSLLGSESALSSELLWS